MVTISYRAFQESIGIHNPFQGIFEFELCVNLCNGTSIKTLFIAEISADKERQVRLQRFRENMASMAYIILFVCLVVGSLSEDPEINLNVVRKNMSNSFLYETLKSNHSFPFELVFISSFLM